MNDVFTNSPDTWAGGRIDLFLYFGNDASDSHVAGILEAAWGWSSLDGPYSKNDVEPGAQELQSISSLDNFETSGLYGVATLPNSCKAAFVTHVFIFDDGLFVSLGLPLGSLGEAYPIGAFPYDEAAPTVWWGLEVNTWLSELGQYIFERVPFLRGAIGWMSELADDELVNFAIPLRRSYGYLVPEDGKLRYYAPNVSDPVMTTE